MVALEKHQTSVRRLRDGTFPSPPNAPGRLCRALIVAAVSLWVIHSSPAQNLNNSGQITNTGTIRVKNQAIGLPPAIDGLFEFFGANQTVPARQYKDLMLSGSGTKSTAGGSFSVSGNVTVANGVVLDIQNSEIITLIGNLNEQGYLRGGIGKTVNLSGGVTTSDFGDVGATISWSGTAPGQTTVTRVSGTASIGNGKQSILRYYDIAPTFGSNLNGTLTFRYSANELNGRDQSALELWRSADGGVTWRRQTGTNLPGFNSIVKSGIVGFSRWTASDTSNLLGPSAYEWLASSLASTSGDGQSGPAGGVLTPFVVTVTDFYGNPIPGFAVTFVVDSIPSGATGYSLSIANAVTDSSGQASTVLTLGNTSGLYRVRASSGSLTGSPRTFTATATSAAAAMASLSGNNQIDTIRATLAPFQIEVLDGASNSVPGIIVNFAITGRPAGEAGSALSAASATSNGLGIAGTVLRLGNKAGLYEVTATTASLPGIQIKFNATAQAGAATALLAQAGTTTQQDTILQSLDSLLTVQIVDVGGNPVSNVNVQFAVAVAPAGATGQSLTTTSMLTDTTGVASTRLTLGSKIGLYQVVATSGSISNSPFTFSAQALWGAPAFLTELSGSGQSKPVTATLDTAFTAQMTDVGGNGIPGLAVQFTVSSVPAGAVGFGLTRTIDTTDANGNASTILTLGTKAGLYRITGITPALPADTAAFVAKAASGAAAQLLATSGDGQGQPAASFLSQPFVVTVHDVFANPVEGATVQFTVTSSPAGASGQQVNPATTVTDSLGRALTTLRLGSLPGNYVVTASVSGATPAQFAATALFILADVNNDFGVDIADLTSIIDHILQKRILTGLDSAKADVNSDGAINVLDVVRIQNSILGTVTLPKTSSSSIPASVMRALASITGELEITPVGVRLNLTNDIPLKGVQLIMRLKTPASVTKTDVVFSRAASMDFFVNSQGQDVRMVAYNLQNMPIEAGSGSIVRFPLKLADTTDVDSVYAIISAADTTFDIALRVPLTLKQSIYPSAFRLLQNYPNPFNAETKIEFEVPDVEGRFVRTLVQVFNLLGEKVKTLARGEHASGHYTATWDGTDDQGIKVPSGVYFYRLVSKDYVTAKKMIMIK